MSHLVVTIAVTSVWVGFYPSGGVSDYVLLIMEEASCDQSRCLGNREATPVSGKGFVSLLAFGNDTNLTLISRITFELFGKPHSLDHSLL